MFLVYTPLVVELFVARACLAPPVGGTARTAQAVPAGAAGAAGARLYGPRRGPVS